jgi:predicted ferric reductase
MTNSLSSPALDPPDPRPAVAAPPPTRPRRTPRWWGPAVVTLMGLSLLVVLALWVHNGGARATGGIAWTSVTSIGRLAGLFAADLLLLQVLVLARIPLVERAFGQDRLVGWHRTLGFNSFNLMLAHILLVTLGYAGTVHTDVVSEFWHVVTAYPGVLLAAVGTSCLVLAVVTSVRAARRRLRYESWHLLHLYASLGVGLALPHQIWNGGDFMLSPWARGYWWSLYAVAAGSVVVYRVAVPAWRSRRHALRVDRVVTEGAGLTSVYLTGRELDRLPVRAGQFFQWRFLTAPGWTRAHPYSLSALPGREELRISVKNLGDDSGRVAALEPGTRVLFEGPYGRLTGDAYTGGPVALFACGIGITPILALLYELPYQPGEATLVYRARTDADVVFRSELDALADQRGVHLVYLLGPRSSDTSWRPAEPPTLPAATGDVGPADTAAAAARASGKAELTDVEALHQLIPGIAGHRLYVCGPNSWTEALIRSAWGAGVAPQRVHIEWFSW